MHKIRKDKGKKGVTRIKEVAFGGIRDRSVLVPMIQYFFSLNVGKIAQQ